VERRRLRSRDAGDARGEKSACGERSKARYTTRRRPTRAQHTLRVADTVEKKSDHWLSSSQSVTLRAVELRLQRENCLYHPSRLVGCEPGMCGHRGIAPLADAALDDRPRELAQHRVRPLVASRDFGVGGTDAALLGLMARRAVVAGEENGAGSACGRGNRRRRL